MLATVNCFLSFPYVVTVDAEADLPMHSQRWGQPLRCSPWPTPVCAMCLCVSGVLLLSQRTGMWCVLRALCCLFKVSSLSVSFTFTKCKPLCPTSYKCTKRPNPARHPSQVIAESVLWWPQHSAYSLHLSVILMANTHYSSGTLIPECDGLSQFKEDTGRPSVPVREFNLIRAH